MLNFLLSIVFALLLDRIFGEPRCFHPLVGFGNLASRIELVLNNPRHSFGVSRLPGVFATLLLLLPLAFAFYSITFLWTGNSLLDWLFSTAFLYLAVGGRSLSEHANAVSLALQNNDLELARKKVGYIVSRETDYLDEEGIVKAGIESVLENGSDSLFAPLVGYFIGWLVGGIVGAGVAVFTYRMINTLDAMWGYRSRRFCAFGWAAARLDDLVNWLPARLCALSYALVNAGSKVNGVNMGWQGLQCWRQQAHLCESPNAGPVMACGAGVLNISLGGAARYHGKEVSRPQLGFGNTPCIEDFNRSISLLFKVTCLWLTVVAFFVLTGSFW